MDKLVKTTRRNMWTCRVIAPEEWKCEAIRPAFLRKKKRQPFYLYIYLLVVIISFRSAQPYNRDNDAISKRRLARISTSVVCTDNLSTIFSLATSGLPSFQHPHNHHANNGNCITVLAHSTYGKLKCRCFVCVCLCVCDWSFNGWKESSKTIANGNRGNS